MAEKVVVKKFLIRNLDFITNFCLYERMLEIHKKISILIIVRKSKQNSKLSNIDVFPYSLVKYRKKQ